MTVRKQTAPLPSRAVGPYWLLFYVPPVRWRESVEPRCADSGAGDESGQDLDLGKQLVSEERSAPTTVTARLPPPDPQFFSLCWAQRGQVGQESHLFPCTREWGKTVLPPLPPAVSSPSSASP